jgi:lipopolysaccharide biosynthesis glycosyltransferase
MTIPIVFSTDKNLVMPTAVCISSLLLNANSDDFYDVYIVVDCNVSEADRHKLQSLEQHFTCAIHVVEFQYDIAQAWTWLHFTQATYFRLFIPDIIQNYDKIFYSDVDVIFRNSISKLYSTIDLDEYYLAATTTSVDPDYIKSIHCDPQSYFCGGFMLLNLSKMRKDKLIPKFVEQLSHSFTYVDQDILNIVCKGKVALFSALLYQFDQTRYFNIMKKELMNVTPPLQSRFYAKP